MAIRVRHACTPDPLVHRFAVRIGNRLLAAGGGSATQVFEGYLIRARITERGGEVYVVTTPFRLLSIGQRQRVVNGSARIFNAIAVDTAMDACAQRLTPTPFLPTNADALGIPVGVAVQIGTPVTGLGGAYDDTAVTFGRSAALVSGTRLTGPSPFQLDAVVRRYTAGTRMAPAVLAGIFTDHTTYSNDLPAEDRPTLSNSKFTVLMVDVVSLGVDTSGFNPTTGAGYAAQVQYSERAPWAGMFMARSYTDTALRFVAVAIDKTQTTGSLGAVVSVTPADVRSVATALPPAQLENEGVSGVTHDLQDDGSVAALLRWSATELDGLGDPVGPVGAFLFSRLTSHVLTPVSQTPGFTRWMDTADGPALLAVWADETHGITYDEWWTGVSELRATVLSEAGSVALSTPGYFVPSGVDRITTYARWPDYLGGDLFSLAEGDFAGSRFRYGRDVFGEHVAHSACQVADDLAAVLLVPTAQYTVDTWDRHIGIVRLSTGALESLLETPAWTGRFHDQLSLSCADWGDWLDGAWTTAPVLVLSVGSEQDYDSPAAVRVSVDGGTTWREALDLLGDPGDLTAANLGMASRVLALGNSLKPAPLRTTVETPA